MKASTEELQHQLEVLRAENKQLLEEQRMLRGLVGQPPIDAPTPPAEERFGEGRLLRSEIERYSRHMLLPQIGSVGVRKMREAKVVVIGTGGLGATVCLYLAAAGIGMIRIVDDDRVELSNLHRQIIHTTARCGLSKVCSAQCSMQAINPEVCVEAIASRASLDNIDGLVEDMDVVIDATDNVPSRYIIGDAAAIHRKPLVWAAALRWEAQLSVFWSPEGPCMRCVFPHMPPPNHNGSCNDVGVCGMIPGMIGCAQALEALKIIVGCGKPLVERMLVFDGLRAEWRTIRLRSRNKICIMCAGKYESVRHAVENGQYQALESYPIGPPPPTPSEWDVEPSALLDETAPHIVIDVRPDVQFGIFALPNAYSLPLLTLQRHEEASLNKLVATIHERNPRPQVAFVVCRRGLASSKALPMLRRALHINVYNVRGGLDALRPLMAAAAPPLY